MGAIESNKVCLLLSKELASSSFCFFYFGNAMMIMRRWILLRVQDTYCLEKFPTHRYARGAGHLIV